MDIDEIILNDAKYFDDKNKQKKLNNKMFEYKYSFENSKRILEQSANISEKINELVYAYRAFKNHDEAINRINDLLYKTATEKGMSLYDLCFRTFPEETYDPPTFDDKQRQATINVTIQLKPVLFELEKGPGYWKGKYYNLKRKMQELIDSKED